MMPRRKSGRCGPLLVAVAFRVSAVISAEAPEFKARSFPLEHVSTARCLEVRLCRTLSSSEARWKNDVAHPNLAKGPQDVRPTKRSLRTGNSLPIVPTLILTKRMRLRRRFEVTNSVLRFVT